MAESLIGIEIEENYFNVAVERIKLAAAQGTLDLEPIEPPACEKELIFEDKKGA